MLHLKLVFCLCGGKCGDLTDAWARWVQVFQAELWGTQPVAVKVAHTHDITAVRMVMEAEILYSCTHPCILQVGCMHSPACPHTCSP